jgi:hypothetical protein
MLLANGICLLICVVARFIYYLLRLPRDIRYGTQRCGSSAGIAVSRPASDVRNDLKTSGYRLAADGCYAEKRDYGYLGTLLIYGGLLLLAFTGICDNLYQFSGTTIHGLGNPAQLENLKIYYPLIKGPLASPAGLPLLGIEQQIFPNKEYPKGATEIVLLTRDGKPLLKEKLIAMGDPVSYRGYNIFLAKQLVDASLTIKQKDSKEKNLFEEAVKLSPLWKKEGDYNYYGAFGTPEAGDGELFFDSTRNMFRIVLNKDGKKIIDTEYAFQSYREKTEGDFTLKFGGIGRWSEIHVVRQRHMTLIWFGGIVALFGLLARIVFRPQRVWLEETADGCRVWGAGKKLLRVES